MNHVRKTYEKGRYQMLDRECIGRKCFSPGVYVVRGATGNSSRVSGTIKRCMHQAYHGCPAERPFDKEVAKQNKERGWKNC